MTKNNSNDSTSPVVPASIDLSVTMRGDIKDESMLADYVAALQSEHARGVRVTYGATIVYMAARDFGGADFVAKDYAEKVGKSAAYVSTMAGLALAVERNITPHGIEVMGKRWAALVQNMTKDVRGILRSKDFTLKSLDAVLFAAADAKKEKRANDDKDKRVANATEPDETVAVDGPTMTVETALTALDQAAAFLALSVLTPAQEEKVADILANLSAHLPVAA